MIEITEEDRKTPLTVADLKEIANEFERQLLEALGPMISELLQGGAGPVSDASEGGR